MDIENEEYALPAFEGDIQISESSESSEDDLFDEEEEKELPKKEDLIYLNEKLDLSQAFCIADA